MLPRRHWHLPVFFMFSFEDDGRALQIGQVKVEIPSVEMPPLLCKCCA
jgi:hypothetical protein